MPTATGARTIGRPSDRASRAAGRGRRRAACARSRNRRAPVRGTHPVVPFGSTGSATCTQGRPRRSCARPSTATAFWVPSGVVSPSAATAGARRAAPHARTPRAAARPSATRCASSRSRRGGPGTKAGVTSGGSTAAATAAGGERDGPDAAASAAPASTAPATAPRRGRRPGARPRADLIRCIAGSRLRDRLRRRHDEAGPRHRTAHGRQRLRLVERVRRRASRATMLRAQAACRASTVSRPNSAAVRPRFWIFGVTPPSSATVRSSMATAVRVNAVVALVRVRRSRTSALPRPWGPAPP